MSALLPVRPAGRGESGEGDGFQEVGESEDDRDDDQDFAAGFFDDDYTDGADDDAPEETE